jgi:lipid-A-disaccharide synthase
MVVAYRLAPLTAFIAHELGLVKLRHFSLPNLLAGEALVPEFVQEAATPEALGAALLGLLAAPEQARRLQQRFGELHRVLRRDANERAAEAVLGLIAERRAGAGA